MREHFTDHIAVGIQPFDPVAPAAGIRLPNIAVAQAGGVVRDLRDHVRVGDRD